MSWRNRVHINQNATTINNYFFENNSKSYNNEKTLDSRYYNSDNSLKMIDNPCNKHQSWYMKAFDLMVGAENHKISLLEYHETNEEYEAYSNLISEYGSVEAYLERCESNGHDIGYTIQCLKEDMGVTDEEIQTYSYLDYTKVKVEEAREKDVLLSEKIGSLSEYEKKMEQERIIKGNIELANKTLDARNEFEKMQKENQAQRLELSKRLSCDDEYVDVDIVDTYYPMLEAPTPPTTTMSWRERLRTIS